MLSINAKLLSKAQFIKLREAKQLIKDEFNESVSLADERILDIIYRYALESEDETLFDIVAFLSQDLVPEPIAAPPVTAGPDVAQSSLAASAETRRSEHKRSAPIFKRKAKWSVGDVIDGKRVTQIYRGAPVFEEVEA